MRERFTVRSALQHVAQSEDNEYGVLLKHGTMELGFYKPDCTDLQQPHTRFPNVRSIIPGIGRNIKRECALPSFVSVNS